MDIEDYKALEQTKRRIEKDRQIIINYLESVNPMQTVECLLEKLRKEG